MGLPSDLVKLNGRPVKVRKFIKKNDEFPPLAGDPL
jgi:hypothetical protein